MRKFILAFLILCTAAIGADLAPDSINNGSAGTNEAEAVAGVTITAGDCLFLDPSDDNKAKLAHSGTPITSKVVGIALHDSVAGRHVVYQTAGTINLFASDTMADAALYVLSENAGKIAPLADLNSGEHTTFIGVALANGTDLILNIVPTGVRKP